MGYFIGTMIFSVIMGFSIYLSLPIVLRKKTSARSTRLLNAIAIGILLFLLADIFSDVSQSLYSSASLYGYAANPHLSILFAVALIIGFFMLYYFENSSREGLSKEKMSLMIAIGIGLQNLTEGLVFGSISAASGLFSGVALVVLVGFALQDMTEGFPIAAPFINHGDKKLSVMMVLFLVGSLPTVIGAAAGFYYSSLYFNIFFDGLAIGAILYVVLPMIRHQFRDMGHPERRLTYAGIFIGFIIGFLVNLI